MAYARLETYDPEEVLRFVTNNRRKRFQFGAFKIRMNSQRYHLFKRSRTCVACGLEGTIMALEYAIHGNAANPHFNLYGEVDGEEVMLTKDHIVPVSKGGADHIDNYQVMCAQCNGVKSNDPLIKPKTVRRKVELLRSFRRSKDDTQPKHLLEMFRSVFGEDKTLDDLRVFGARAADRGVLVKTTNKKKPVLYFEGMFVIMDKNKENIQRLSVAK